MAGAVVGSRDRIAARPLGPDRHRRDPRAVRGVPRPARDRDARRAHGAPGAERRWHSRRCLERQDGVNAPSSTPGLPSHPQADVASRILDWRRRDALGRPRGRPRRGPARSTTRSDPGADREPRLGPHDGRPPADQLPPLARRRRARRRRDHRGPAPGVASGSRTRPTSSPTSRPPSTRRGRRSRSRPARRGLPSRRSRRAAPAARPVPGPAARLGNAVWGLLTSVNFAVVQIIVLSLFAVVGMTLRQLPGFAFRSPTDYANEMATAPRAVRPGARRRASWTRSSGSSCSTCSARPGSASGSSC